MVDNVGWEKKYAEEYFNKFAPLFEIPNEVDFVISEAKRLRLRFPKIPVAPLLYRVEDHLLYLATES
ncbi:MAG: hypothetical protein JJE12_11380 [Anaerolineales bacterium]|nr:hypothetical protein [Anaerolineales bacterium]